MTDTEKEQNKSLVPSRKYEIDLYSDTLIRRGLELAENLSEQVFVQPDQSDRIESVAFSPDERFVISGGVYKVKLWDISSGEFIKTLIRDDFVAHAIKRTAELQLLIDYHKRCYYQLHEPEITDAAYDSLNEELLGIDFNISGLDKVVCFSPDGQYYLSTNPDRGSIKIGKLPSGKIVRSINRMALTAVFLPEKSSILVVPPYEDHLELWNFKKGVHEVTFERIYDHYGYKEFYRDDYEGRREYGRCAYVSSMTITPDGQFALAGVEQADESCSTEEYEDEIERLESGIIESEDSFMILWNVNTNSIVKTFKIPKSPNSPVVISADGKYVISSIREEDNDFFTIWDIQTSRKIKSFGFSIDGVKNISISPNGKYALALSYHTLKLWNVETGGEIWSLETTSIQNISITISPNGKCALLGCTDGAIRILSIPSGKEIAMMVGFSDDEWVTITPEGYYTCSANGDIYIKVRINNKIQSIKNFKNKYYTSFQTHVI